MPAVSVLDESIKKYLGSQLVFWSAQNDFKLSNDFLIIPPFSSDKKKCPRGDTLHVSFYK
jgi:hypothetical protein